MMSVLRSSGNPSSGCNISFRLALGEGQEHSRQDLPPPQPEYSERCCRCKRSSRSFPSSLVQREPPVETGKVQAIELTGCWRFLIIQNLCWRPTPVLLETGGDQDAVLHPPYWR